MKTFPCVRCLGLILAASLLAGCGTVGYYYQSAAGHLGLMCRARDIDAVLRDRDTPTAVRDKLQAAQGMRNFASEALALPDNDSYRRYADLEREYVVWNVFAAPPLSVEPHQWCFPVVGCVVYRGYFDEADARAYAATLRAKGLETYVAGVPAYSTLGWFDDPLLNTVLDYPEPELAGLVFHELAHQVAYVPDDSVFNESFATAVEIEGVERWLRRRGRPEAIRAYHLKRQRDREIVELILDHRRRLEAVYAAERDRAWKLRRKTQIIAALKARYTELLREWDGYRGYGRWFRQELNNAHFAVIAAYYNRVPAFQALLARHDGDLTAFYEAVRELGRQPPERRSERLDALENAARASSMSHNNHPSQEPSS